MITKERILSISKELEAYCVDMRRQIHRYAEPTGTEVKTSALIRKEAEALGLKVEEVSKTGLIATLDTGRPGAHIALRADIDALAMKENPNNLAGPRNVVSDDPGTCHACGHDAHTAMLLTAMKALCGLKDELEGVVYFCFEEGEENGGGIAGMLDALSKKEKVDASWGIHVYNMLPSGTISVDGGPRMAGVSSIDITVRGRGGHGSRTDKANNPVYAAAAIVNNLGTVSINQLDADETVTINVCNIIGGQVGNIIPDTCKIAGSLRFFNRDEGLKAIAMVKKVAENVSALYDCTVEYGPKHGRAGLPTVNDEEKAQLARDTLNELLPEGTVISCPKWYGSESMGQYLQKYPGAFAFLGIANEKYGSGADHHNEFFDVDEGVLPIGVISTLGYALAHLDPGRKA